MNIDQQIKEAQDRIAARIRVLSEYHLMAIESRFAEARLEAACLGEPGTVTIGWGPGAFSTGRSFAGSINTASVLRTPNGTVLYCSDPLYINVPEILAIWLRSTTLYRLARRVWLGERLSDFVG